MSARLEAAADRAAAVLPHWMDKRRWDPRTYARLVLQASGLVDEVERLEAAGCCATCQRTCLCRCHA